jgi:glutamate dehydrogenase
VIPYFPAGMRDEFGDLIPDHRLYRQLLATDVAGEIVDQMGIVWAHDLAAELGRPLEDVAATFWVARHVTGAGARWAELEELAADSESGLSATDEATLHGAVAEAVTRLVRKYLNEPGDFHPGEVAARDEGRLQAVGAWPVGPGSPAGDWEDLKVAEAVRTRFSAAVSVPVRIEAIDLARLSGRPAEAAAIADDVAGQVATAAGLGRLAAAVGTVLSALPPPGRLRMWQANAVLDDLSDWKRRASAAILADPAFTSPEAAVARWAEAHAEDLRRASLVAPSGGSEDAIAAATLALRRLARGL